MTRNHKHKQDIRARMDASGRRYAAESRIKGCPMCRSSMCDGVPRACPDGCTNDADWDGSGPYCLNCRSWLCVYCQLRPVCRPFTACGCGTPPSPMAVQMLEVLMASFANHCGCYVPPCKACEDGYPDDCICPAHAPGCPEDARA